MSGIVGFTGVGNSLLLRRCYCVLDVVQTYPGSVERIKPSKHLIETTVFFTNHKVLMDSNIIKKNLSMKRGTF